MKKKHDAELLQEHTADCSHSNSDGSICGGSTALPLSSIKETKRCIPHIYTQTKRSKRWEGKKKGDVNYGSYLC